MRAFGVFGALYAAAVFSAPTRGSAQRTVERSARAAVDSFFAVVARERWDSAAIMLDLARFEPYFKRVVRDARGMIPSRQMTVEDLMAEDSTMPRAVAEWHISQAKKASAGGPFNYLSYEFAGIRDQHDLFALTVPAAAARWLEAKDGRTQMREAWRRGNCSLQKLPDFPAPKRTVLAVSVVNVSSANTIHTDDQFGGDNPEYLSFGERVIRMHRVHGRWHIEPRDDLFRPSNTSFAITDCR